jgi:hypothetical protein
MATDLGKVGIRMRGTWDSSTAYEVLDAVYYNYGTYIAKQSVPAGTAPTNTSYWQKALDAPISPTIINEGGTIATSNTLSYTGISYTIPANKSFVVSAFIKYNSSEPKEVYLSTSDVGIQDYRKMAGGEKAACTYGGYTTAAITLYVWARYGSAGNNSVSLTGFYF